MQETGCRKCHQVRCYTSSQCELTYPNSRRARQKAERGWLATQDRRRPLLRVLTAPCRHSTVYAVAHHGRSMRLYTVRAWPFNSTRQLPQAMCDA